MSPGKTMFTRCAQCRTVSGNCQFQNLVREPRELRNPPPRALERKRYLQGRGRGGSLQPSAELVLQSLITVPNANAGAHAPLRMWGVWNKGVRNKRVGNKRVGDKRVGNKRVGDKRVGNKGVGRSEQDDVSACHRRRGCRGRPECGATFLPCILADLSQDMQQQDEAAKRDRW